MMPGMTGAVAMTGQFTPIPLSEVALVDSTTSVDTATVALPTGHRIGDLALLYDWCYVENDGGDPASVVPSGFTSFQGGTGVSGEIDPPDQGKVRVLISYKILDGTEPAETSLTGMNGNRREAKIVKLFRGNVRIKSVTPKSLNTYITFGNPSEQTIAAAAGLAPLVAYAFHAKGNGTVGFTTNSPAFSEIVAAGTIALGGHRIYNSAPSNHAVDADGGGSGSPYGINLCSGYLEMA